MRTMTTFRIPDRFNNVSIDALNQSSRKRIAMHMNADYLVPNERNNRIGNYIGFAELLGFGYQEIEEFKRMDNPTNEVFNLWCSRNEMDKPTLGKLWEILEELGRMDVLVDCKDIVIRDAEIYLKSKERRENSYALLQSGDVNSTCEGAMDQHVDESLIVCRTDVIRGSPQHFDAYVCHTHKKPDVNFVKVMIGVLEHAPYNLSLYVPDRDNLPGGSKYVLDANLIKHRCRRMVIVISRNFKNSAACDFHVKFCHSLSPGAKSKKLIPILIEPKVMIPDVLSHLNVCDYTKEDMREWFWDRLSEAIKAPL